MLLKHAKALKKWVHASYKIQTGQDNSCNALQKPDTAAWKDPCLHSQLLLAPAPALDGD